MKITPQKISIAALYAAFLVFVSPLLCRAAGKVEREARALRAGAARRIVNPKKPSATLGWVKTRFTNVYEDLRVQCLVFEDSASRKAVFLGVDTCILPKPVVDRITKGIEKRFGIGWERVSVNSSHTHSAPPLSAAQAPEDSAFDPEYVSFLVEQAIAVVGDAIKALRPVEVRFCEDSCTISINRRLKKPDGTVAMLPNPKGVLDNRTQVLKVTDRENGSLVALLVKHSAHPVTVYGQGLGSDFPGFMRHFLEAAHPGAVAVFMQGCTGNIRVRLVNDDLTGWVKGNPERAREFGRELADAVERAIAKPGVKISGPIQAEYAELRLPLRKLPEKKYREAARSKDRFTRLWGEKYCALLDSGKKIPITWPYRMQAFRFGPPDEIPFTVVALDGEVFIEYALAIEKKLGRTPVMVFGYTNGVAAYIPTKKALKEGGYEPAQAYVRYFQLPAPYSREVEELVVNAASRLARSKTLLSIPEESAYTHGIHPPPVAMKQFEVEKGFKVELTACEPHVVDPVAMVFDEDGRLYVVEMNGVQVGFAGACIPERGKVVCLEDPDGDGYYERSRVFVDRLTLPTGLTVWKGGVVIGCAPDILYCKDLDGDGRADTREVLFRGFDTENFEQQVNSFQWGIDNWIHASAAGPGGKIRSLKRPHDPPISLRTQNFRFHVDTGEIEATTGAGQFGLYADKWDRWFTSVNTMHAIHCMLPNRYLKRNPYLGVRSQRRNLWPRAAKLHRISPLEAWRVERTRRRAGSKDAKRYLATELIPGGYITAACGNTIYLGDAFPPEYEGNHFITDCANNLIRRDIVIESGASFILKRGGGPDVDKVKEFQASPDNYYRPVALENGPDGTLYVADMFRGVIETPVSIPMDLRVKIDWKFGDDIGRIYRFVPDRFKRPPLPRLSRASAEELVRLLEHPNGWYRRTAHRLLIEREAKSAVESLKRLAVNSKRPVGRLHALWTLKGLGALEPDLVLRALSDEHPRVREHAVRLAESFVNSSKPVLEKVLSMASDPDFRVRYQLAFSLGEVNDERALDALSRVAARGAESRWLRIAVLSSLANRASAFLGKLLEPGSSFTAKESSGKAELLKQCAALVGARQDPAAIGRALAALSRDATASGSSPAWWRERCLAGLFEGLRRGRRGNIVLKSGGENLLRLLKSPSSGVRRAARSVASLLLLGDSAALASLIKEAEDTALDLDRSVKERIEAIETLGALARGRLDTVSEGLEELLHPAEKPEIQEAAIRALALQTEKEAAEILIDYWPNYSPAIRKEVLSLLFSRRNRIPVLLDALEKGDVQLWVLDDTQVKQLLTYPDKKVRARAEKLLAGKEKPNIKEAIEKFKAALKLKGDYERGKKIFVKLCSKCHKLDGEGVDVGARLQAIRDRTKEALLVDIIDPNASLQPDYASYLVETTQGFVMTGIIVAETSNAITLRGEGGVEHVILRDTIENIGAMNASLMPEGLEKEMTFQDMADLIHFLKNAKE